MWRSLDAAGAMIQRSTVILILLIAACKLPSEPEAIAPHPVVGSWHLAYYWDWGWRDGPTFSVDANLVIHEKPGFKVDFTTATHYYWGLFESSAGYAVGRYEMLSDTIMVMKAQSGISAKDNPLSTHLDDTLFVRALDSLMYFSHSSQIDSTHFKPSGTIFTWKRQP